MTDPAGQAAEGAEHHQDDEQSGHECPVVLAAKLRDDDRRRGQVAGDRQVQTAEDEDECLPDRGHPEDRGKDEHRSYVGAFAEVVDRVEPVDEQRHQCGELEDRRPALCPTQD
jgi:hypothetical protein